MPFTNAMTANDRQYVTLDRYSSSCGDGIQVRGRKLLNLAMKILESSTVEKKLKFSLSAFKIEGFRDKMRHLISEDFYL